MYLQLRLLSFILLFSLCAQAHIFAQTDDAFLYVPIEEIISDHDNYQEVALSAEGLIEFSPQDTGQLIGKWTKEAPNRNLKIGQIVMTEIKENGIRVRVYPTNLSEKGKAGDLVGLKLKGKTNSDKSIFYDLARMNIFFTDIYGGNSYRFNDFFREDSPQKSDELISIYTQDIQFVAGEMVKQGMENQLVEGGRFDGMKIFDAMTKTTEKDVRDFLGYVRLRPLKYMGYQWKISETYATWVVSETPTASDLLINSLVESINEQQNTRVRQEDCEGQSLFLNLKKGKMNKVSPTASMDEVKQEFPCFTGESEEGQMMNCNGGVFFLNHDFYFYTGNDYIEVRTGFKGKMSLDLMGKSVEEVEAILGKPDRIPVYEEDDDWGFSVDIQYLYRKKYGALGLAFDPETRKVEKIAVHARNIDEVEICW
jgi:hypothetical protein